MPESRLPLHSRDAITRVDRQTDHVCVSNSEILSGRADSSLARPAPIKRTRVSLSLFFLYQNRNMPHFLYTQFFAKNKPVTQNLSGRTVCVTGSNIGLGLATAVHLARLDPAKVILAVRNVEKGEAAKLKVVEQSGIAPDRVVVWKLDLETFAGVEAFADKCNNELDRLDVLIQNAGVISQDGFKTSPDGHELT